MKKNDLFVFMGRSGCGKGTQVKLFIEYLKKEGRTDDEILYLETGGRFRDLIKGDGYTNKLVKDIYDNGKRVHSFLAAWTWTDILIEEMKQGSAIILDGSPRSQQEADVLNTSVDFYSIGKGNFIFIDVSADWVIDKVTKGDRNRSDDHTEALRKKAEWFNKDALPAVESYRNNKEFNFLHINGEQTIEKVHEDIVKQYDEVKDK